MDIRKLQRAIVDGLEDVKAQHIAVFNTEALSPLFERVIIATGASNRQTKSLAASVRDKVRERGLQVMRTEGEENGEWIIVDCGAAVVHIMQPSIREYYRLEEIWGGKAVKMKLGDGAARGLVKASEPDEPAEPAADPPRRATAGRAAAPAKAVPKKRATARRPAAPRQPPSKGGVRTLVAGKPARKTAAKVAGQGTGKIAAKGAGHGTGKSTGKSTAKVAGQGAGKTTRKGTGESTGKSTGKSTSRGTSKGTGQGAARAANPAPRRRA